MAIRGLSMSEREEIVLPSDPGHPEHADYKAAIKAGRDPEKPTKFFMKPLSKGCRIELGDMGPTPTMRDGSVTMQLRGTQRSYALVERSLVGWENFTDAEGRPIAFVSGTIQTIHGFVSGASGESMLRLEQSVVAELSALILRKNGMTKELVGNSAPPSPQLDGGSSENGAVTDAPVINNENVDALNQP